MCFFYAVCIISFLISLFGSIGSPIGGSVGMALSLIGLLITWMYNSKQNEEKRLRKERKALEHKSYESWKYEKYKDDVCNQICEYGAPDKRISIEEDDIDKDIAVFSETKQVYIFGKFYPFADILSCTVDDETTTIKGKMEMSSVTTSNTGSTIGRAVIGGLIAGPAGAIIGGSTSSKTTHTDVKQGDDTIIHKYYINIGVNNFTTPNIRFFVGGEGSLNKVNEIVAMFNVIINNK